jgi:hypothetical protein
LPADITRALYRKNRVFCDKILKRKDLKKAQKNVKASVLLISFQDVKTTNRLQMAISTVFLPQIF